MTETIYYVVQHSQTINKNKVLSSIIDQNRAICRERLTNNIIIDGVDRYNPLLLKELSYKPQSGKILIIMRSYTSLDLTSPKQTLILSISPKLYDDLLSNQVASGDFGFFIITLYWHTIREGISLKQTLYYYLRGTEVYL